MKIYCSILILILLAILVCLPASALSASESYLKAINADLQEFTTGSFELEDDSPWITGANGDSRGGSALNNLADFDKFLHKQMPGTYILYRKLTQKKKQQIFDGYISTGDLAQTKTSIFGARGGKR